MDTFKEFYINEIRVAQFTYDFSNRVETPKYT